MKKTKSAAPTPHQYSVLRHICNYIPVFLVDKLARATNVDAKARTFSPWSHIIALLFAQLTHAIGLNDVCDALGLHSGPLSALRGATPPTRNNLSHANKHRDASLAEQLFWSVLDHLKSLHPRFARSRKGKRLLDRFKRAIHAVDSTAIPLVASCLNGAKHRRRKAAAKCHLRLDLQSFLPSFAIIDTAKHHDNKRAREVCAGLRPGEIVLLRFLACVAEWNHSFTRLWALLRTALWKKLDVLALLRAYGAAGGSFRMLGQPEAAYLPGFA